MKLWEMEGGKEIKNVAAHAGGVSSIEFSKDGKLVSTGRDRITRLWDGNGAAIRELPAFNDIATEVAFTHDAARVVAGDWLGEVRLSEAADGKLVAQLPPNPPTLEMLVSGAHGARSMRPWKRPKRRPPSWPRPKRSWPRRPSSIRQPRRLPQPRRPRCRT